MISSSHNPKIQHVRALLAKRQERENAQAFVVEGVRLAEEAMKSNWHPLLFLFSSKLSPRGKILVEKAATLGVEVEEVLPGVMNSISDTETTQGLLAVFSIQASPLPENPDFILILDNLRDPGNLGTLLRSAEAAGVQAVILSPGTVDVFSPKVVRSAMGAHFRLPIHSLTWQEIKAFCHGHQSSSLKILVAKGERGIPYWKFDLHQALALVIGGEAQGASEQALQYADELITIPMPGSSESLNAAVAGSILLFEVVRQRYP